VLADEAHVFPEAGVRLDCAGGKVEASVDWWEREASAFLHVCDQRSLQTASRSASKGLTFLRSQCIPGPFSRAWTTSLLALSTMPEPIGQPCARRIVACILYSKWSTRDCNEADPILQGPPRFCRVAISDKVCLRAGPYGGDMQGG
jgi:hypothetical protein